MPPLAVDQIVARMEAADGVRAKELAGYQGTRHYELVNLRFNKRAKVTARVTYTYPGSKSFEVLAEEGSHMLCERVLKRLIRTEQEGSEKAGRPQSRIDFVNYRLRVTGTESIDGRNCYVLELVPLSKSPFLVKGRAWIDASEYAVVRLEGVLAKKPSIWVGSPHITQRYAKHGAFWLPASSVSTTEAPIFGRTDLTIEYAGYEIKK